MAEKIVRKRPSTKIILITCLALVIVGLFYVFSWYNKTPSSGAINNDVLAQTTTKQPVEQNQHYNGSTVSFEYPKDYGDIRNNQSNGLIIEQFSLVANKGLTDKRTVGITVKRKDSGVVMREDAAYKLRAGDTAHFASSNVTIGSNTAEQFLKQDQSEITYFIDSPKYYAIIAGTTSTSRQKLADDMNLIVGNFRWQK